MDILELQNTITHDLSFCSYHPIIIGGDLDKLFSLFSLNKRLQVYVIPEHAVCCCVERYSDFFCEFFPELTDRVCRGCIALKELEIW